MTQNNQHIAIIGSGISGLTAAYLLHNKGGYKISLFEADSRLGGHTATIDVDDIDSAGNTHKLAIDTGFIVYNDWTYPNFIQLLSEIGVDNIASTMSFSVSCNKTGLEYNGNTFASLFAQRRNIFSPRFYRMLLQIVRFNKEAVADLDSGAIQEGATLGEYLDAKGYNGLFKTHYLVPMCAAIWSASTDNVLQFPLKFFVRFFKNHGLLNITNRPQWRVVKGGSRSYIEPLTRDFASRIFCNKKVVAITRQEDQVHITFEDGEQQSFDQVVIAAHSDQALAMLSDASDDEKNILGAIPYNNNDVVLHTDTRLLPKTERAWAAWNYLLDDEKQAQAVLTYNMNILQHLNTDKTYCVTLNSTDAIDPKKIVGRYQYAHPVFTLDGVQAQQRWQDINGQQRTWFCGAYWANGFHEDGVLSAVKVANGLGIKWGTYA